LDQRRGRSAADGRWRAHARGPGDVGLDQRHRDDEAGAPVGSAQVQVTNASTGFRNGALTRDDGRYTVAGLEVGAGYSVTVRRIGFAPITQENVRVSLGQTSRVDLQIARQATVLTGVTVTATTSDAIIGPDRTGVQTTINDSTLRRLPTLGRNFTDFVQLTPQVSNAAPGSRAAA
jgi:hypothetical protein